MVAKALVSRFYSQERAETRHWLMGGGFDFTRIYPFINGTTGYRPNAGQQIGK